MRKIENLRVIAAALLMTAAVFLASCSVMENAGGELDETMYQFSYEPLLTQNDEDNLTFTLFMPCEDMVININDMPLDFVFMPYFDKTVASFNLSQIPFDELFSIEILLYNGDGIRTDRLIMSDVCFVTDGVVPNGVKTLVMINYSRDEFPEFESDDLTDLTAMYIIDLPSAPKNRQTKIDVQDYNNITSLEVVYLDNSIVEGELKYTRALENLRGITIINCPKLSGDFDVIDDFTVLEKLELENTKITGGLKDLVQMVTLKDLKLKNNSGVDGDIQFLKKISSLQSLYLEGGKFEGELLQLKDITRLKALYLINIKTIEGNISTITGLSALETLHIEKMPEVYGQLSTVPEFANLKSLYIEGGKIEGDVADFASMSDLRQVMLYSTDGIMGDLASVVFCTNLEKLHLVSTSIEVNINRIKLFKKLKELRLEKSGATGDISGLSAIDSLRKISLINEAGLEGDTASLDDIAGLFELYVKGCGKVTVS